jgi:hypothetical protein
VQLLRDSKAYVFVLVLAFISWLQHGWHNSRHHINTQDKKGRKSIAADSYNIGDGLGLLQQ